MAKGKGKAITVAEVKALAMKHYNEGGDGVVECWEDSEIQEAIDGGWTKPSDWLKSFRTFDSVRNDIINA